MLLKSKYLSIFQKRLELNAIYILFTIIINSALILTPRTACGDVELLRLYVAITYQ